MTENEIAKSIVDAAFLAHTRLGPFVRVSL
jgi:hypothetical protein